MSSIASPAIILEKFAGIVANSLRIDPAGVVEDAYLDELGAESLDLLEITMETEDAFNVLIAQKNILQTAQEVFGPGVLVQGDQLTDVGYAFLRRRMPDTLWSSLPDRPTVSDLNRLFLRVQTWVWMISGLLEHTPRTCASCGASLEKAVAGRLKCNTCAAEYELTPGEEINRRWVQQYYRQEYQPSLPTATAQPAAPPAPAV